MKKRIEEVKKQRKCVSNTELKKWLFSYDKGTNQENSKITAYYDWHVNKRSNKRHTAIL